MNYCKLFLAAFLLICLALSAKAQQSEVFVGSTPCSKGTKPLPGIPANADCELMKWELTLFKSTFKLHCTWGLPKQGTTGFIKGGTNVDLEGSWSIVHGKGSDANAIIYRLADAATHKTISFLQISKDVIHLLDDGQHLMIGSPAWSYTLNRINK